MCDAAAEALVAVAVGVGTSFLGPVAGVVLLPPPVVCEAEVGWLSASTAM